MVTIDVTLVFKIMTEDERLVEKFCYTLGPLKLDEMLKAFQEEAIRGMVRKRKYNEIYGRFLTQSVYQSHYLLFSIHRFDGHGAR